MNHCQKIYKETQEDSKVWNQNYQDQEEEKRKYNDRLNLKTIIWEKNTMIKFFKMKVYKISEDKYAESDFEMF